LVGQPDDRPSAGQSPQLGVEEPALHPKAGLNGGGMTFADTSR
jgi:hypothetical protein